MSSSAFIEQKQLIIIETEDDIDNKVVEAIEEREEFIIEEEEIVEG